MSRSDEDMYNQYYLGSFASAQAFNAKKSDRVLPGPTSSHAQHGVYGASGLS